MRKSALLSPVFALLLGLAACERGQQVQQADAGQAGGPALEGRNPACDSDNGGLVLPPGFCARVIADNLGFIRHFVVRNPAELYITQRNRRLNLGGLLAARDSDADGYMDQFLQIDDVPGMGIGIWDGQLYFAAETAIYRYDLDQPWPLLAASRQQVVAGLPAQPRHAGKPFAFDKQGNLYVNIGAPSNACRLGAAGGLDDADSGLGDDPCGQLATAAGIWRFAAAPGQRFTAAMKYAGGIRNAYALAWHPLLERLFVVQHGRDGLHELWPHLYDEAAAAELPAEVMLQVRPGSVHPWPYCYFDAAKNAWITAPEYGGDGERSARCRGHAAPVIAFPAHYGPNDMLFYTGQQFPERYRYGAFVAFHGSYNRGRYEQVGYQLVFIPYRNGRLGPDWEVFADGFAGAGLIRSPQDAEYRPTGLAEDSRGALYVSDSVHGRIWRIRYVGDDLGNEPGQ